MDRKQLVDKLDKLQDIIRKYQRNINQTNIPEYCFLRYFYEETGIDLENVLCDEE